MPTFPVPEKPDSMKPLKYFLLLAALWLQSCAPTQSMDAFYEKHKEGTDVLAFRVPPVMFSLLGEVSPDMKSLVGTTTDLRYIRLPASGQGKMAALNQQVTHLTSGAFIEVFRKNEGDKRNIVAIRERGNTVRNIMVYSNNAAFGSVLFIEGKFDPEKVRTLAREDGFGRLEETLTGTFGSPGISE